MGVESTQPLIEMSTMNLLGAKARPARKVDNLTTIGNQLSGRYGSLEI
jgi:hypothetical protein